MKCDLHLYAYRMTVSSCDVDIPETVYAVKLEFTEHIASQTLADCSVYELFVVKCCASLEDTASETNLTC
ncbi:hypothetical protein Ppb6_02132 [Photorhabdus australis subsp. thailandensis]|uniref:Uncharacterized protein n=1 Tax=Photorhabdus australis subsp. thailandensis TaxID=2805096 RepID=A0A1C0U4E5_9GAMM|nr:hypothetical protein Ppb6_02132 [Photorhabdus australis subsp. thailandensis]